MVFRILPVTRRSLNGACAFKDLHLCALHIRRGFSTSVLFVDPRHACAVRVTVVEFVRVFVNRDLTSGASVRPENDITYSTVKKALLPRFPKVKGHLIESVAWYVWYSDISAHCQSRRD